MTRARSQSSGSLQSFFVHLAISSLSLGIAARIVPGIHYNSWATLVLAAFLLGLVNAILRPVLIVITIPVTILTLGLFLLVINAAMLGFVAWLLPGFYINGFGAAFFGWLIMVIVGSIANSLFGDFSGKDSA